MILSDDDLFSLTENVWTSVLGLDLERSPLEDAKIGETAVTACVQITGDWEGAVTVRTSVSLARALAAAMFAMEADELSEDEVEDALGEVANMTGGNVKGIAPGSNTLAIPTVVEGDENAVKFPGTTVANMVVGATCGEHVVITVFSKND